MYVCVYVCVCEEGWQGVVSPVPAHLQDPTTVVARFGPNNPQPKTTTAFDLDERWGERG